MDRYDLAIAWNWEFDKDFVSGIEHACRQLGVSTYQIDPYNREKLLDDLKAGKIAFCAFFDRASDADTSFLPLARWMEEEATYLINPYHRVVHAIDKATMHLEFHAHGLHVPDTIILPPFNEQRDILLNPQELERIGKPFVIKPANTTGGGTGVVLNAQSPDDVLIARQEDRKSVV